jgi:hypothetical protein
MVGKLLLLAQVHVCDWELQGNKAAASSRSSKAQLQPNLAVWQHLPQLLQPSSAVGSLEAHLVNWPLLHQLLHDGQYHAQGSLQLLAGGRDALLPAKYETHDRLVCQVSRRTALQVAAYGQPTRSWCCLCNDVKSFGTTVRYTSCCWEPLSSRMSI